MDSGLNIAVIPLGATEQHGDALPFGTDTFVGQQIAVKLADNLNALLLPALPFGLSIEHMSFPGTLTLSGETLIRVVRELCESLIFNGFDEVILLVSHLGNLAPAQIAAEEVVAKTGAVVCVSLAFADMREVVPEILDLDPAHIDWDFFDSHGGAAEAAMVLAHGDLIDREAATTGSPSRPNLFYHNAMKYPQRVEEGSPTGQWGDPLRVGPDLHASVDAQLGEQLIRACSDRLAERFRRVRSEIRAARSLEPAPQPKANWRSSLGN
jgi:creatinine amidohydrolase